jgi:hypothetical protein
MTASYPVGIIRPKYYRKTEKLAFPSKLNYQFAEGKKVKVKLSLCLTN